MPKTNNKGKDFPSPFILRGSHIVSNSPKRISATYIDEDLTVTMR